jgi:hypothetical protein
MNTQPIRCIRALGLVSLALTLGAAAVQAQPIEPPPASVYFQFRQGGPQNGFVAPWVHGHLVEGGRLSVFVDRGRFLFGDPAARLKRAWLIVRDGAGVEVARPELEVGPGTVNPQWARGSFDLPSSRELQLGLEAEASDGRRTRDTDFERFYRFPLAPWSAPALLSFQAQPVRPTPGAPLRAGEHLAVDYALARADQPLATDAGGQRRSVSSCKLWYMVGETLSLLAKVRFLDQDGAQLGEIRSAVVLGAATATGLGPDLSATRAFFPIPAQARRVQVYFEARNYNGPCAWDSDGGRNFEYEVLPAQPSGGGLTGGGLAGALPGQ